MSLACSVEALTSPAELILLTGAGVLAGVVGSAGAISSLIAYPAMLAVGIAPLPANVTNSVAFVAMMPGSALSSRPELRGQGRWLRALALIAGLGGGIGFVLLLLTPRHVFNVLVPYLIFFAALTLLAQPRLTAWREHRVPRLPRYVFPAGLFVACVYNGYFGAGSGIVVLALTLLVVDKHFPTANALKNVLLGFADIVAAIGFALFGPVHWSAAGAMAAGLLVGSYLGPKVTRRLPHAWLRVFAALAGFALAIWLWFHP